MGKDTNIEGLTCFSSYSTSASANAVREEGDQSTGFNPLYTYPVYYLCIV